MKHFLKKILSVLKIDNLASYMTLLHKYILYLYIYIKLGSKAKIYMTQTQTMNKIIQYT